MSAVLKHQVGPSGAPTAKPKLRVCVLAACPFPANHGTPGSIRELSEGIAERGHEVHIVTYPYGEDIPMRATKLHRVPKWFEERKITVGPTKRRPIYDFQMIFKAISVVRKYDCDLIHAHGYEAALVAFWARLATGRKFVYSAHQTMADELASYNFFPRRWMADWLAWLLDLTVPRMGNRCIPHSENLHQFLVDRNLQKKTEPVINFGIDLDEPVDAPTEDLRSKYGLGDGPVILYAGVMDRFQRLDLLLEAMVPVIDRNPQAKLLLVVTIKQDKHQARLKQQAMDLGIASHVVLTEPMDLLGVRQLLEICDLTVVPRPAAPGFPIKLLNYMAASRACVMFESSSSGLEHGCQAWLVKEDTSAAMGNAIAELLKDDESRKRIAGEGFRFVREHHDRRESARRVCDAYIRMLEGSRRWRRKIADRHRVPSPADASVSENGFASEQATR